MKIENMIENKISTRISSVNDSDDLLAFVFADYSKR